MKTFLLFVMLTASFSVMAESRPIRQSYFSVVGLLQRLHQDLTRKSVPLKNLTINYQDPQQLELLEGSTKGLERLPNLEGTFSFTNAKTQVDDFYVDMGLCRGYSSLRRKARFMGFFDATVKGPDREDQRAYRKFYKKIIKDLRNFRPRLIPGFASLNEMSQDPILKPMLQWQVLHEWRNKNFFRGTGTRDLLRGTFKRTPYETLLQLRDRIARNAELNHNTMVWLSEKKSSWIHVLEAYEVSAVAVDGSFEIYFWNDKFLDLTKAHSKLMVSGDGKLTYDDFIQTRVLHAMGITRENDGEMLLLSERREQYCEAHPSACLN